MTENALGPREAEMRDVKPWPFRPTPLDGELLSSFISRLAHGHGMKPVTFLNSIMGSRKNYLAQDLDNFAPPHLANRLALGCEIDPKAIRDCTLFSFEGNLNLHYNKQGRNPWILPVSADNNARLRPGLQFCPACIGEHIPVHRLLWRLAFVTCCTVHGLQLRDRCPWCSKPIRPLEMSTTWQCYSCNSDMRVMTPSAPFGLLAWQARAERALANGWIRLGDDYVASPIWFMIARQIGGLLINGQKASSLRSAAAQLCNGSDQASSKLTKRQPLEYIEINDRHRLFAQVAALMEGWPHRFVQAAWISGIRRSHAIKDMPYVPFVFDEVLRGYLDASPYHATEGEVAAAAAWLRRTRGSAHYRDLKKLCGESRIAIYRHMDYERTQKRPSVWLQRSKDRSAEPLS